MLFRHRFTEAGTYELRVSYASGSNRNPRTPVIVMLPGDRLQQYEINQILKPEHDGLFQTIDSFLVQAGDEITVKITNRSPENGVVIADSIQWLPEFTADPPTGKAVEFSKAEIDELEKTLKSAEAQLKKLKKAAPDVPSAMCVIEAAPDKIGDTPIRIRGMENNHGPAARRGFLQVASWTGLQTQFRPTRADGSNWRTGSSIRQTRSLRGSWPTGSGRN